MKNSVIHNNFKPYKAEIDNFIFNFDNEGEDFGNQERNSLKLFNLNDRLVNIKSFRIPNIVNQIAYKFFRKSKAQRSYEYANKLTNLGIGTPQPIAYYEFVSPFVFKNSYYVSKHLNCDLTYRELTTNFNYPNHEAILRAFTRFTFNLHEKGIHFLDHSPGNTLIEINQGDYKFYLVDLNRMEFKSLDFETRIKNFAKLTIHKKMVEVMSDEYAKCSGEEYSRVFNLMWSETEAFQARYHRKRRLKNKIKFWKSAR
ncbi:lipopolysaccharide kinase InaA family protein [Algibacter pectinivorans]|uniref:Lipopolysaccharide kinase (Kdo/WaaP) family protein n=1 Tax=Algibacter pectinivorans TaxID=870482 RepID=A0A1I1RDT9_9FLAO|nr:lipopolysaccharide kinase InaA family protein [Algibacter pectinivorans]SFD32465.1 Lipopolysaccharide kinase (Kdo/WaaP) family protein [Algibacter pectinivorans]